MQVGRLIEYKSQDILVVHHRYSAPNDQLAAAHHRRLIVTEVCVLPSNSIIHLVHADNILYDNRLASANGTNSIKVSNVAEAVTSQRQGVGSNAEAGVTQVERLLAVIRRSWISVWNGHLTHIHAVEERSSIIEHIVQNRPFMNCPSLVE